MAYSGETHVVGMLLCCWRVKLHDNKAGPTVSTGCHSNWCQVPAEPLRKAESDQAKLSQALRVVKEEWENVSPGARADGCDNWQMMQWC